MKSIMVILTKRCDSLFCFWLRAIYTPCYENMKGESIMMFENFGIEKVDRMNGKTPFAVVCKDRASEHDDERWVMATLTKDEAKQIYEYLGKFFKD